MTEQAQGQTAPEIQETQTTGATQEQEGRSYTDKDVDKFKGDARREARSALLKDLGFEKADDLKSFVSEYRSVQDAAKDELERAIEERDRLKNERESYVSQVNQRVVSAELRVALQNAGVNPDRLKVAARLADTSEVEVKDDGTVEGLDDVVEGVKDEAPELFGEPKPPTVGRGSAPGSGSRPTLHGIDKVRAAFG